jgi:hypothetical protein
MMKLLFIVDGRSPIALNWVRYFVDGGHAVHLVSTYPCQVEMELASLTVIPAALGQVAGARGGEGAGGRKGLRGLLRKAIPVTVRTSVRQWLGPLTLAPAAKRLRDVMDAVRPDLIHAMRIPFEGMLLAQAVQMPGGVPPPPTLVSVWGNDFTLHAPANKPMGLLTRLTLQQITALHTDCQRDLRLARAWGWRNQREIVLPGNGGIDMTLFAPPPADGPARAFPWVVNPRGMRAYVRNDTFFAAIPLVLAQRPDVRFVCPNMAGEAQAEHWIRQHNIAHAVELLPRLARPQMAEQFQAAQVVVSVTEHDGTPNTLLEAMACGCYPVAGDIESIHEWITPGVNGSLVPPGDAGTLAQAIVQALDAPALRQAAAAQNVEIICQRAEYAACMDKAEAFYRQLVRYSSDTMGG